MSLTIQSNGAASISYRNLSSAHDHAAGPLERLSSGLRINRAADDAAGLTLDRGLWQVGPDGDWVVDQTRAPDVERPWELDAQDSVVNA